MEHRLLIVNEDAPRAASLREVAELLGHDVVVADDPPDPDLVTAELILVGRGSDDRVALILVAAYARAHQSAVVALTPRVDPEYAAAAAQRGAHSVLPRTDAAEVASALEVAWSGFAEYRRLLDAFERRAAIEQAKGILMARHAIGAERAFELLRRHSQRSNHKVVEIANAISQSHALLISAGDAAVSSALHQAAVEAPQA
ncbi:MAG TPA: ANTAR domain-containing protein [Gaiellaceae bacterium]|jgi:AmiR/NasT family two-component response regulator|nr:ANTAR domain-containing protein [Gaiellaceae bacterium]